MIRFFRNFRILCTYRASNKSLNRAFYSQHLRLQQNTTDTLKKAAVATTTTRRTIPKIPLQQTPIILWTSKGNENALKPWKYQKRKEKKKNINRKTTWEENSQVYAYSYMIAMHVMCTYIFFSFICRISPNHAKCIEHEKCGNLLRLAWWLITRGLPSQNKTERWVYTLCELFIYFS